MIEERKAEPLEITCPQAVALGKRAVFVDVRDEIAYQHGHIPGAIYWNGDPEQTDALPQGKTLILYCSHGEKSAPLAMVLREQGRDVYHLAGGYRDWLIYGFDGLRSEELERYDRQIILPEMGADGQRKLKRSSVLIIGAGGLGAPAALYLAGAGVGTIGIMDGDTVGVSNLQRQIIHSMETLSQNKAESAKQSMERLNDNITVKAYPFDLTAENAEEIIGDYDFVIDGADNFATKFLINDACVLLGKPFCHGGILRMEGQVMTYVPGESPCYRCVFESVPEPGEIPSCSQAGILGPVAGVMGSIQAMEALKYLLGMGELLTGKLLVWNGLTMEMRLVTLSQKNKHCRVCGTERTIFHLRENAEEYTRHGCH